MTFALHCILGYVTHRIVSCYSKVYYIKQKLNLVFVYKVQCSECLLC